MVTGRGDLPDLGDLVAGKYMIRRVIGEGGMGIVFQAEHLRLRQPVAIKFLHPQYWNNQQVVARFDGEARAIARLRGVHVVRVLDVDVLPNGAPYIVQQYLEGLDLYAELRSVGRLPIEMAVDYICQAAHGIHEAHELGIVHRDLKPGNLFLSELPGTDRRLVRVLDFGVSTSTSDDEHSRLTSTEDTLGTGPYMSPEQQRASRDVDGRSDVWSLGVILFELLTGSKPFKGTRSSVAVAIAVDPPPSPSVLRPDLPPRLERLILRALEKSPDARFSSAKEFALALAPFGPVEPISTWLEGTGTSSPGQDRTSDRAIDTPSTLPEMAEPEFVAAAPPPTPAMLALAPAPSGGDVVPITRASGHAGQSGPSKTSTEELVPASSSKLTARQRLLLAVGFASVAGVVAAFAGSQIHSRSPSPSPPSAMAVGSPPRECAANIDCMKAHAGAAWICRKEEARCVALESPDCKILSEPGDVESDRTIWVGAMFPTSGRKALSGGNAVRAVDLARRDFVQMTHGIPSLGSDLPRPLAVVACDDANDKQAVAHHLVDDVGVPAIVGFANSEEVIDLATSIFIPKQVLAIATMNASAQITAIPQPAGEPRMVWRSTTSSGGVALPIAAILSKFLEPKLRATRSFVAGSPIRVALLRRSDGYGQSLAGALFERARFNQKSLLENGSNFQEFVVNDTPSSQSSIVDELLKFRPHVLICVSPSRDAKGIFEPLEARWPTRDPRPYAIFPAGFEPEVFTFLGTNKDRRGRYFGLATPSITVPNAQFTTRYNEVFPDKVTLNINPSESYDGMYLVAYAAAVAGEKVTGPDLARAIGRLVPPGKPIDVGPLHIFEAIEGLRRGANIDLDGAMTPLDFDLSTGETTADYSLQCADVNEKGAAFDALDSGLTYKGTTKKLVGALHCP